LIRQFQADRSTGQQLVSASVLILAGQPEMTGSVISVTVISAVQLAVLLPASVTVSVTVVTPSPIRVPATGDCVTTVAGPGPLRTLARIVLLPALPHVASMVCDVLFGEAEPPPDNCHLDPPPQGSGFGL